MTDSPLNDDERTRAADLFSRFAEPVANRLRLRYRGVDPDLVADAVIEAILAIPANEIDVLRCLYSFARQRLRVRLRGDGRRRKREAKAAENRVTSGQSSGPTPIAILGDRELAAVVRDRIALTEMERTALDHWLIGRTDPGELAAHLGLSPDENGKNQAVTILARIRKRIQRERERLNPGDPSE